MSRPRRPLPPHPISTLSFPDRSATEPCWLVASTASEPKESSMVPICLHSTQPERSQTYSQQKLLTQTKKRFCATTSCGCSAKAEIADRTIYQSKHLASLSNRGKNGSASHRNYRARQDGAPLPADFYRKSPYPRRGSLRETAGS